MMSPFPNDDELQRAAYSAALESVRGIWEGNKPALNPNTRLGSLSGVELQWIVSMAISQWIVERSRQACEYRCSHEAMIRTLAGTPEPWEMGAAKASLPALGDVVEDMGISGKAVGEWSKDEILWFVWSCFKAVDAARTARDENPSEYELGKETEPEQLEILKAG